MASELKAQEWAKKLSATGIGRAFQVGIRAKWESGLKTRQLERVPAALFSDIVGHVRTATAGYISHPSHLAAIDQSPGDQKLTMREKSSGFRLAPPTKAPSMSG